MFKFKLGDIVYHKISTCKGMVTLQMKGFSYWGYTIVWDDLTSSEHEEEELSLTKDW